MKYFLDTEFHEYHKQPKVVGINAGNPIPTIDLISIGIISENIDKLEYYKFDKPNIYGQIGDFKKVNEVSYYAICKDFNLKDAWYANQGTKEKPNYWLRDNVLLPIYNELNLLELGVSNNSIWKDKLHALPLEYMSYFKLKKLINKYGKTKKQIAEEIKEFVYKTNDNIYPDIVSNFDEIIKKRRIEFYAYYADYDWVVFAQLFGTMMKLPEGFPMYCKDLKQELDSYVNKIWLPDSISYMKGVNDNITFDLALEKLKGLEEYPKQKNEHNALADAKWNKELFKFLKEL